MTLALHAPDATLTTPTPDMIRTLPTLRQSSYQYTVQTGDTLGSIAQTYGVSVETLLQANHLADANALAVGQNLIIPAPAAGLLGPSFKVIPDSELVYGPASAQFDVAQFIQNQGGYLASYTQVINNQTLSGADVLVRVAQDYSVNPRLLLALIEYRSKWVTRSNPDPVTYDYPLGFVEPNHSGLYHQLTWAANELNRGFYLWRANAVGEWVLADGTVVPIDPTINAGTAGVQGMLAIQDNRASWETDVNAFGLFEVYYFMFGNPFDLAVEPLLPFALAQPQMELPFEPGAIWAFTGGPHAGWDSGSAWAALDFARIQAGTYVHTGDRIGHPSCEGGIANAAHLHLVRKYNGVWISADTDLPFILSGWKSSGTGVEYDGFLKRGSSTLQAEQGISDLNQISH